MTMMPRNKNKVRSSGAGPGNEGKKKKKQVKEIDGALWLLDDRGNPVKKVRRKNEGGEPSPVALPSRPPAKKKNVAEIDGQMFLLDEAGNPVKKIRRKGEAPKQQRPGMNPGGPKGRSSRQVGKGPSGGPDMRRQKSARRLGAPGIREEYTDDKGRKVIIEADGSKTIIAKNGKRLRPKKKNLETSPRHVSSLNVSSRVAPQGDPLDGGLGASLSIFDELWDDIPGAAEAASAADDYQKTATSLSAKIDEVGKENQELAVKLQSAEEEIENLVEENKKVKAKSVKAVTEMMQVKCDFTEANTELSRMRAQVEKLRLAMKDKEKEMDDLHQLRKKALELERVEKQNQQLRQELEAERRERALEAQQRQQQTLSEDELEEVTSSEDDDDNVSYESDDDEDSEVSVDFATGLPKEKKKRGDTNESRAKSYGQDSSKHIGEIQVNFNNSMSFQSPDARKSKTWWGLKK